MKKNVLNNERGASTLLGALVISIAITTLLSTFYIYVVNQAKYHAKIKEAYQMINVMESVAAATRKAYDMGQAVVANSGTVNCPTGTSLDTNGTANTNDDFCLSSGGQVCITREDGLGQFCLPIRNSSLTSSTFSISPIDEYRYAETGKPSWAKKWLVKLNYFYSSPNLYNKKVDTAIADNEVIKKPVLLDWLTKPAYAYTKDYDSNYPDGDYDYNPDRDYNPDGDYTYNPDNGTTIGSGKGQPNHTGDTSASLPFPAPANWSNLTFPNACHYECNPSGQVIITGNPNLCPDKDDFTCANCSDNGECAGGMVPDSAASNYSSGAGQLFLIVHE